MRTVRVLLVDDDPLQFALLKKYFSLLKKPRYEIEWESTFAGAQRLIGEENHDIYLVDYYLGAQKGTDLIKEAIAHGCQQPMILLTAREDLDVDEEALAAGAVDFLVKTQINEVLLNRSIRYAHERKKVEHRLQQSYETIKRQQQILEEELEQARTTQTAILPQTIPQHDAFKLAIQYVRIELAEISMISFHSTKKKSACSWPMSPGMGFRQRCFLSWCRGFSKPLQWGIFPPSGSCNNSTKPSMTKCQKTNTPPLFMASMTLSRAP